MKNGFPPRRNILSFVSDKTHLYNPIVRYIGDGKFTIDIGNCTICSTFYYYTGSNYSFTRFVGDSTRNGFALCSGSYSQCREQSHEKQPLEFTQTTQQT